jgi:hypothetical protein
MEEVRFEIAKLAFRKGFDMPVLRCYNENGEMGDVEDYQLINFNSFAKAEGSTQNLYSAPTLSELQKWLREERSIHAEPLLRMNGWCAIVCSIPPRQWIYESPAIYDSYEKSHREALKEALQYLPNVR